ncbi:FAD-dependent oxidoreductase [Curvibacter sp. CHRR-16]|uniref:NAD(P)/FAD-dependent oxidoreductase n=1 Tax=Curvibacter sp. CHRR-16 TaxID=2835872 RepID=UPI001BD9FA1C|nr:FAD-dependent oxidoreductase [Curvibacter sp. CHRR-16]MBT0569722.1 FAD-dependent oxidoreductase [Curvibacter sp. CHRR-16]
MIRITELKLPLSALPVEIRRAADAPSETEEDRRPVSHPTEALQRLVAQTLQIPSDAIAHLHVHKRSFDARKADLQAVYIVDVALVDPSQEAALLARLAQHPHVAATPDMDYHLVGQAPAGFARRPVVVGFGPCGMLAALVLAQMGLRPIVLERGPSVRQRTKDTWGLWRKKTLNPNSNVQFGEGGAGTFSDGKLYSQIKDPRHLGRKVLQEFVRFGAPEDILFEAHPHIGTFKLVKVVEGLREEVMRLGGEVRFGHMVSDLLSKQEHGQQSLQALEVKNILENTSYTLEADHVIMALGHSARDTFAMLYERGVAMQAKPFSVGVRIEHPQSVIDRARWGRHAGHPLLGAADYKLVHHAANGRAVYSFCMCPGGTVVAATSEPERVVTNGMSQYSRAERNANAGMVVGIEPSDYPQDEAAFVHAWGPERGVRYAREAAALRAKHPDDPQMAHPLSGVNLQRQLESLAYVVGGSNYEAPAQLVGDFLAQRPSGQLGAVLPSYKPGIKLGDLSQVLPVYAIEAMREALPAFGRKIRGYDMPDALMTGVETRTSSPIKIPRGEDLQCTNLRGLYPAGEGASYAGGILSAGVDGIKVAEAVGKSLLGLH